MTDMTLLIVTHDMKAVMPIMMSVFLQILVFISMGYMLNKSQIEAMDSMFTKSTDLTN